MPLEKSSQIVIVGAGCFGLSTAYHLLQRGFTSITILDRSSTLPAPDAASTDLNKIVRSAYADEFYTRLARVAIQEWQKPEWGNTYHQSGVVVLGSGQTSYTDSAYKNDVANGARIEPLNTEEAIRAVFPPNVKTGSFEGKSGYINRDGGWANASQGIKLMMDKVLALGGRIVPGKAVVDLMKRDGKTAGVRCADGSEIEADLVVIASGSWTASNFPGLDLGSKCLATGQSIVTIQLTPEEAERYRDCPVFLDFGDSGFYLFPPNKDNIVKAAIHAAGYTYTPSSASSEGKSQSSVSTPVTALSHGEQGLRIPKEMAKKLREHIRSTYPELGAKPFSGTRMCWYTDSPDDDWLIGYHPNDPAIAFATAGSGHAYKFLPIIGRLVADAIEGKLEPTLVQKFALDRQRTHHEPNRFGETPRELKPNDLCTPDDLLP
ncbi:FAD dependent oxidoreductase [Panus rudis PR-1116 ss-1]|nr:FAD dependent oxidoreductase [Panus rudis PR-1116 ss-1]